MPAIAIESASSQSEAEQSENDGISLLEDVIRATRAGRDDEDGGGEDAFDPAEAVRETLRRSLDRRTFKAKPSEAFDAVIAEIDLLISTQVDQILHHPEFQAIEAAWTGVQNVVRETAKIPNSNVRVRIRDIRKSELAADIADANGDFRRTRLWKDVCGEYFTAGGEPFGALVLDLPMTTSRSDVSMLETVADVCEDSHTPVILGGTPSMFGVETFADLPQHPKDINEIFNQATKAAWKRLRRRASARATSGWALPRRIVREAYSPENNPARGLPSYSEQADGPDSSKQLWGNPAYDLASRIAVSYGRFGWPLHVRGRKSGGTVEGMPLNIVKKTAKGRPSTRVPVDFAPNDLAEAAYSELGFAMLSHYKNTDFGVFFAVPALYDPPEVVGDPKATAAARLAAQLPMTLAVSRFAHILKAILRDEIGSSTNAQILQDRLNLWISQYCMENPEGKSDEIKARHPLKEARIVVEEISGRPGAIRPPSP